jgi:hypothetical protein
MSKVVSYDGFKPQNLDCVEAACARMGLKVEHNAKVHAWLDHHQDLYPLVVKSRVRGGYDIGFRADGTAFFDNGVDLQNGRDVLALYESLAEEVVRHEVVSEAMASGWMVEESRLPTGELVLSVSQL